MNQYKPEPKMFDEDFSQVDILNTEPLVKTKEQVIEEFKNIPIEIYKKSNKLWTLQSQLSTIEDSRKLLKLNMKKIISMEHDEKGKSIYSSDTKLNDEVIIRLDTSQKYAQLSDEASYIKMEIQSYQTKIAYLERLFDMYNTLLKVGGIS